MQRYVELTAIAGEQVPRKTAVINNQLHHAAVLNVDQIAVPSEQLGAIPNGYLSNATKHVVASDSNCRIGHSSYPRVINEDQVRAELRLAATGNLARGSRNQPNPIALHETVVLDRDRGTSGVNSRSLSVWAHCGIHTRTHQSHGPGTHLNASTQPGYMAINKSRLGLSATKPLQPNSCPGRADDYRTSSVNSPSGKHDRRLREGIIQRMPYHAAIYIKYPSQAWAGDLIYLSAGKQVQSRARPGQYIVQASILTHIFNLPCGNNNGKSGSGNLVPRRNLSCQRHSQYDGGGLPARRSVRPLTSTLTHGRYLNHKKECTRCSVQLIQD
ncbi:hypothetical protein ACQKEN_20460 [Pseudomonas sp. NPDC078416]|uniref:hypothetical protein n=1 Tax=Pseudomonas sp. NPDC078416 TaxID=3390637 RepID=UPI003D048C1F